MNPPLEGPPLEGSTCTIKIPAFWMTRSQLDWCRISLPTLWTETVVHGKSVSERRVPALSLVWWSLPGSVAQPDARSTAQCVCPTPGWQTSSTEGEGGRREGEGRGEGGEQMLNYSIRGTDISVIPTEGKYEEIDGIEQTSNQAVV